jgi:hypothetical protein
MNGYMVEWMDDEWKDIWLDGWLFVLSELGCQSFLPLVSSNFGLFQIFMRYVQRNINLGCYN